MSSPCTETLATINLCKQHCRIASHVRVLTGSWAWQEDATFPPWSSIVEAPFWCLPEYVDLRSMLLRPLATPVNDLDSCVELITVSTNGQLSSEDGSTRDYGKVEIMGLRPGMPVPGSICDIPCALVVVEVPSAWTGDMHNLIGQQLVKGVPVVVVGEAVNVKPVVSGLCDIVQGEITVINLLLYNTSRKIGNYSMAENLMCILSCNFVPAKCAPGCAPFHAR